MGTTWSSTNNLGLCVIIFIQDIYGSEMALLSQLPLLKLKITYTEKQL